MKKYLVFILAMLLMFTAFLAACDNDTKSETPSTPESSVNEESKTEDSSETPDISEEAESSIPDESEESIPEASNNELSVFTCRYTESPYFALIGQCADGATVTGEADGETVTSESYKGWFSLRLSCAATSVDVKLTQTVDGEQVGEILEYTAEPEFPGNDMWPMITGKNFQFFLQSMLPDFEGTNIPDSNTLNALTNRVSSRLSALRQNNPDAEIIYIIAPSAMTIYPELVPEDYEQTEDETKLDLTAQALKNGGATVIDLKTVFAEHKNDEMPLYYKLDSHWADYGAYIAYTELFNHISTKFPEATPRPVTDFNWNPKYYQTGDLSYYLATDKNQALQYQKDIKEYSYFRTFNVDVPVSVTSNPRYVSSDKLSYNDVMTYEKTIRTYNENLPSCIVMRDSFSTQIYDILAERMNVTHYYGMWDYSWNISSITSESPDYIIYVVSEWNLDDIILYG